MARFAAALIIACLAGIYAKRMAQDTKVMASEFAQLSDTEKVKMLESLQRERDSAREELKNLKEAMVKLVADSEEDGSGLLEKEDTIKSHANRGCCKDAPGGGCACSVGYGETCEEYCP